MANISVILYDHMVYAIHIKFLLEFHLRVFVLNLSQNMFSLYKSKYMVFHSFSENLENILAVLDGLLNRIRHYNVEYYKIIRAELFTRF